MNGDTDWVATISCASGYVPVGAGFEFSAVAEPLTPPPLLPRLTTSKATGRAWTFEMAHPTGPGTLQVRCVRLVGRRFVLRTVHVTRTVGGFTNSRYFAMHCRSGWNPLYAGWEGAGVRVAKVGRVKADYLADPSDVLDLLCVRRGI